LHKRYVYPDGYLCERIYPSLQNPDEKVWSNCHVFDRGGDHPVFRVELKDDPTVGFEGTAPSNPWLEVIKRVEDARRKAGTGGNRSLTISGPEYFGFSTPLTVHLMQQMEGVDSLAKFQKRPFVLKVDDEDEDDTAEDEGLPPVVVPRHSQRTRPKLELTFTFDLVHPGLPSEVIFQAEELGDRLMERIRKMARKLRI
jgi:hypothetical protein